MLNVAQSVFLEEPKGPVFLVFFLPFVVSGHHLLSVSKPSVESPLPHEDECEDSRHRQPEALCNDTGWRRRKDWLRRWERKLEMDWLKLWRPLQVQCTRSPTRTHIMMKCGRNLQTKNSRNGTHSYWCDSLLFNMLSALLPHGFRRLKFMIFIFLWEKLKQTIVKLWKEDW